MIKADTPTLWEIKKRAGRNAAIAILILALTHVSKLVNVKAPLNIVQIGEIANDLLDDMGYMKVEEVKFVLKRAIRTQKMYERIDYNIVMNWFAEYDSERVEEAMRISEQKELEEANRVIEDGRGISFEEYKADLRQRATCGDEEAEKKLKEIETPAPSKMKFLSIEDKHQKELDFKQWYFQEYLKNGKKSGF